MVTLLLIVVAVLVALGLVGVLWQVATSPLMWCCHLCCGSVGFLLNLLASVLAAIADGFRE